MTTLALQCAEAIQAASDGKPPDVLEEGFDIAIDGHRMVVGSTDTENWMIIPGSRSLTDWIDDFDAHRVQDSLWPGTVHAGYALMVHEYVKELSATDWKPNLPIVICGHSEGGAIATAFGLALPKLFPFAVQSVITFGAPPFGDAVFASAFDTVEPSLLTRYIYRNDPVPYVIPWLTQCGKEVQLGSGGWHWFNAMFKGFMPTFIDGVKDHAIDNYVEALQ